METVVEIRVDKAVLFNAEVVAKTANTTVPELLKEYILNLSKRTNLKRPTEISNYNELVKALNQSRIQYENGNCIIEEDYWEFLNDLMVDDNV